MPKALTVSIPSAVRRCALVVALGWVAAGVAGPGLAQERTYQLGPQDRLRIHVYEWPALTGEFAVGSNGRLAMPLIGEVEASGLDTSNLSRTISARLKTKAGLSELPDVAVDVQQYRPFYVLGRVERSGEYAFRPGMVVLNAISIAGGIYRRTDTTNWAAERDVISTDGEAEMALTRLHEFAAREVRLKAEAEQAPDMPDNVGDPEAERYLAEERRIFRARADQFKNGVDAITERIKLFRDEIGALDGLAAAATRERVAIQRELSEVKELLARGLAPTSRILPLERAIAQIDREFKENEALILRARQQINIAQQMLATLKDERVAAAANDLRSLRSVMAENRERYRVSRLIVKESGMVANEDRRRSEHDSLTSFAFTITRAAWGKPEVIDATETTPLQPGDIVNVYRPDSDAPAPAATVRREQDAGKTTSADAEAALLR